MHKMIYPQPNWNSFRALLTYDYDGNERTMVDSLTREEAIIVSDGSYDINSGEGSAAIIFETCTTKNVSLILVWSQQTHFLYTHRQMTLTVVNSWRFS